MAHEDDFTIEWHVTSGKITDFRVTKGVSIYNLPWYRRILMRVIGRSHWHYVSLDK